MFRKIISNLPFSTTLVEQLGSYAKIVKKEAAIRKLGLFFVILTLIVQLFIVLQPPESANARENVVDLNNSAKMLQNEGMKLSISATNITQGFIDATTSTAGPQEQISYSITVQNMSPVSKTIEISNNLTDILEYADLIDNGGGYLNSNNNVLSWQKTAIDPNSIQTRTYTIRLLKDIPATAKGINDSHSFDCKLTNTFGNTLKIDVSCPAQKIAEQIITNLPHTNQIIAIIMAIITLAVTVFFYARSQQIKKEIQLIRKDINSGII